MNYTRTTTYAELVKGHSIILNNEIYDYVIKNGGEWEYYSEYEQTYMHMNTGNVIGQDDYDDLTDEEQEEYEAVYHDIYQWYIITADFAEYLKDHTDETVFYNVELDMYLWAVHHWGTPWNVVYLDIRR